MDCFGGNRNACLRDSFVTFLRAKNVCPQNLLQFKIPMPATLSKEAAGLTEVLSQINVLHNLLQSPAAQGASAPSPYAGMKGLDGIQGVIPPYLLKRMKK